MVDVDSTLVLGKPELSVKLDRAKAADLGVQVADVASTLQTMVAGEKISTYNEDGEQYEVHVRAVPSWRTSSEGVSQMNVPSTRLGAVRLDHVASFEESQGPSQVDRLGRRRQVTITANLRTGLLAAGGDRGHPARGQGAEARLDLRDRDDRDVEGDGQGGEELPAGLRAVVHLHVPGPGGPVRVLAAPDHHPDRACR